MSPLKAGDKFPEDVKFQYVPYTPEAESLTACGVPTGYDASKEWTDKKVILVAVPGAFTPTCQVRHLPTYIEQYSQLKAKGVDVVAVLAGNDPFVMSAWSKANGVKNDDILFLTDPEVKFSSSIGWSANNRASRYAMIIDHGTVTYAEVESGREVSVSGADAVIAKL